MDNDIYTKDQLRIRDTAREFACSELAPNAARWDHHGWIEDWVVVKLGKLGLLGMIVPEAWGGSYTDYVAYALAVEEIAAGCGATAALVSVPNSVGCGPILNFGTDEQKRRYLPDLTSGRSVGCFCLTEPQAGSEAHALKTRAVFDGAQWVLNGSKQFATNGKRAKVAVVFAVTDPELGKKGLSAFIVPTDTPGFVVGKSEQKLGIRGSDTSAITFDNCKIQEGALLGPRGRGLAMALSNLEGGRIGMAAQAVGIARIAYEAALTHARIRKQSGETTAEFETYLLAKKMIEAGAGALQIENQVSDEKQCGHQDGKVTVPHEVFLVKVPALRYAFQDLGVPDGVIVARTDSLGAGLTQQIAFSKTAGDSGDQYNAFLDCEEIKSVEGRNGDVLISRQSKLLRPKRLPSNLYQFRPGTGEARCVLDSITALQNGAELLWVEIEKPHIEQIAAIMDRIRKVIPTAKLVYNNSPSFNWTLNFRQQVLASRVAAGKDVSAFNKALLMSAEYDATELAKEADERIRTFQTNSAKRAGIFHHLITLPTYHTEALSTDNLSREYFGAQGMLGYALNVQRQEIRQGIACVKHQNMAGSDLGDDHKEYFAGEAALKAGGAHNTMGQFEP